MKLSKKYLETISENELLQLADLYGIFVPKGLCRNFIIRELLELDEENEEKNDIVEVDLGEHGKTKLFKGLPLSYNSTEITAIIRDPMWLFVFWDFCKADLKNITEDKYFESFFLRVLLFSEYDTIVPYDYYDIDIKETDRSRFVHLSFDDTVTCVELCARFKKNNLRILASSNITNLKRSNLHKRLCSMNINKDSVYFTELMALKKSHFENYHQAFCCKEEHTREDR